jgi:citrate synthase
MPGGWTLLFAVAPRLRPDVCQPELRRWNVGRTGIDILRAALVLCADHELNVSSFTARCVASAGSPPYAVVIAGLSALEGPRHGGAAPRVHAMLDSVRNLRPVHAAIASRVRHGDPIEGFGHPLYRDGDPRARLLLDLLGQRYARSAGHRFVKPFADAAMPATGGYPNVDFALASVARVLRLPAAATLMLFAIGRTVGWIGHALEQCPTGQLIRPRANTSARRRIRRSPAEAPAARRAQRHSSSLSWLAVPTPPQIAAPRSRSRRVVATMIAVDRTPGDG